MDTVGTDKCSSLAVNNTDTVMCETAVIYAFHIIFIAFLLFFVLYRRTTLIITHDVNGDDVNKLRLVGILLFNFFCILAFPTVYITYHLIFIEGSDFIPKIN